MARLKDMATDVGILFILGTQEPGVALVADGQDPPVRPAKRRQTASTRPTRPAVTQSEPWGRMHAKLAQAAQRLVNRVDACGGYRDGKPTTRKDSDTDWYPAEQAMRYHFAYGHRVIGLHSTSPDNSCRWIAFDIDAHAGESEQGNIDAALTIADRLTAAGLKPRIFSSDGRGGIHVWAVFDQPRPSDQTYDLAQRTIADLPIEVETFPKQASIDPGGFGNWIRLPGHHHKRDHWSQVWIDGRWGTAEESTAALLAMLQDGS